METTIQQPIKEQIEQAQQKWLQSKIFRSRWKSLRSSGIGDVCNRRIFYYMTCGELANEIDTDLIAIFEEGKEQEPAVRRYLSELGYEIKKAGYTENWDKFGISGQLDGTLDIDGKRFIVEIKTVSEYAWESIQTVKDMTDGYYLKWYAQLQTYLLMFNYDKGLFILKRKQSKQIRIIEVDLDYEYAEGLLKKAELIKQAITTNTPPEFLGVVRECKKCPFFSVVCNPPFDFGETIMNLDDTELETKLITRETLIQPKKEYDALDKEIKAIKDHFPNMQEAFCGEFHIIVKEKKVTKYDVPDDVKEPYKGVRIDKVMTIERIGE